MLPAGEVEQARVIAEGETAFGLASAFVRQANQPGAVVLTCTALDEGALGVRPHTGAVINVGQFVQDGGEHFPAHGAVGAVGLLGRGRAVGQARQQFAVEVQLGDQRRLPVGIAWHVIGPAHQDLAIQLLDKARWQLAHGLVQQRLTGLLFSRTQAFGLELQMQRGLGAAADQQQAAGGKPTRERPHSARMASASS